MDFWIVEKTRTSRKKLSETTKIPHRNFGQEYWNSTFARIILLNPIKMCSLEKRLFKHYWGKTFSLPGIDPITNLDQ